jgi:hypothetical protein
MGSVPVKHRFLCHVPVQCPSVRAALHELRLLPACSPNMNADEFLNRNMKSRLANKPGTSDSKVLKNSVLCYMDMLENDEELVQSFFRDKSVRHGT